MNYTCKKVEQPGDDFSALKVAALASFTAPPDGMWESFRAGAIHWGIYHDDQLVGYGLVNDDQQLLQFFLENRYLPNRLSIFSMLLEATQVVAAMVGTHQPVFLSTVMHFAQSTNVHTYLFTHVIEEGADTKEGTFVCCQSEHLEEMVAFYDFPGAPEQWLRTYLADLIGKKGLFKLSLEGKVIGSCEVRPSAASPQHADIGMIVSPDHRRQGYGTYLLGQAKRIAQERSLLPICSCEVDNLGSLKAIQANGFRSVHQLLEVQLATP